MTFSIGGSVLALLELLAAVLACCVASDVEPEDFKSNVIENGPTKLESEHAIGTLSRTSVSGSLKRRTSHASSRPYSR